MLARDAEQLLVRCDQRDISHAPAGDAQPGDWIEFGDGAAPRISRSFVGGEFPSPATETARLSPARRRGLRARGSVLASIRTYFADEGFLEIEAPTLVPAPGMEIHIKAVRAGEGYLITSPEFSMKRLLAGGLQKIYATPRCFRSEEAGAHHSVEFTMLEWYRAFSDLEAIMADTEAIVHRAARSVGAGDTVRVSGREVDVKPPWERMTVREAFAKWAGIDLVGDEEVDALAAKIRSAGVDTGNARQWDDLFYLAFLERVQPKLDTAKHAIFLTEWPAPLAALARLKASNPACALRFEAYVGGVELANAFDELTDPVEQRRRFEQEQEERRRRGLDVYPIDEKFLAAMEEGLPPCAGIALGVDRLAMLVAGAESLRDVSAFTGEEL